MLTETSSLEFFMSLFQLKFFTPEEVVTFKVSPGHSNNWTFAVSHSLHLKGLARFWWGQASPKWTNQILRSFPIAYTGSRITRPNSSSHHFKTASEHIYVTTG
jgi:hypothetical protein